MGRRRHADCATGTLGGSLYGATKRCAGCADMGWACGRQRQGGGGGGGRGQREEEEEKTRGAVSSKRGPKTKGLLRTTSQETQPPRHLDHHPTYSPFPPSLALPLPLLSSSYPPRSPSSSETGLSHTSFHYRSHFSVLALVVRSAHCSCRL